MMNGPEKSDPAVVAWKSANKAEQSAAEPMEQRARSRRAPPRAGFSFALISSFQN